ncbi:MAG: hypothetical protein UX56_C0047G0004 [Candidatus Azambacteria bacterium GW2011_GWD2_46_48]|uniref:Uncharacterized protein n=1 Tax=Candidatus Azambacteria bacterium GW2011_GWD2_46_48 TaxID=1618623 RepID=A0A0G1Q530_9BACT|nr:MAG: hypothetical protein UX56_C0047G0004 [Candidatus Azambacteria bacterium GW2011_GWD2_46_48]
MSIFTITLEPILSKILDFESALLNPRLRPPNGGAKPFFTLYYCALWKIACLKNLLYTKSVDNHYI